jgi:hypothetical protein
VLVVDDVLTVEVDVVLGSDTGAVVVVLVGVNVVVVVVRGRVVVVVGEVDSHAVGPVFRQRRRKLFRQARRRLPAPMHAAIASWQSLTHPGRRAAAGRAVTLPSISNPSGRSDRRWSVIGERHPRMP